MSVDIEREAMGAMADAMMRRTDAEMLLAMGFPPPPSAGEYRPMGMLYDCPVDFCTYAWSGREWLKLSTALEQAEDAAAQPTPAVPPSGRKFDLGA